MNTIIPIKGGFATYDLAYHVVGYFWEGGYAYRTVLIPVGVMAVVEFNSDGDITTSFDRAEAISAATWGVRAPLVGG